MAEKDIVWRGTSLDDLKAFPDDVKRDAGHELGKVQCGLQPTDYKPVSTWGIGVIEIRLTGEDGEYRVVYVARFDEAIYVLHAFDKKTQQTSPRDVNIIKARYKAVLAERRKM